jgi:hypothetical protein
MLRVTAETGPSVLRRSEPCHGKARPWSAREAGADIGSDEHDTPALGPVRARPRTLKDRAHHAPRR